MKIAVIGAGLAGLATASFLRKNNNDVTVFEKTAALKGRGLGLLIQPPGLAVLKHLGLYKEIIANSTRIDTLHIGTIKKNRTLLNLHYNELSPRLFGIGIHRGKLFSTLLGKARELGVKFESGCDIQDAVLENGQRRLLDSAGNDKGSFDLVIDASGYRSPLRKYATVTRQRNYASGYLCGICEDNSPDNSLQHSATQRYQGKQAIVMIPIGKDAVSGKKHVSFFWAMPSNGFKALKVAGLDAWKKEVIALLPAMKPYLDQITSFDQLVFARYADVSLKTFHAERLAFVGDSAHSTSPLLGQSSTMGFIDAFVLSEALKREKTSLPKALAAYSAERKDHVQFQQNASRTITHIFQSVSPPVKFFRNFCIPIASQFPLIRKRMTRVEARAEVSSWKSRLRRRGL